MTRHVNHGATFSRLDEIREWGIPRRDGGGTTFIRFPATKEGSFDYCATFEQLQALLDFGPKQRSGHEELEEMGLIMRTCGTYSVTKNADNAEYVICL